METAHCVCAKWRCSCGGCEAAAVLLRVSRLLLAPLPLSHIVPSLPCPPTCIPTHALSRQDQGKGHIAFVDVAAPDYSPEQNAGISFEKAMEASWGLYSCRLLCRAGACSLQHGFPVQGSPAACPPESFDATSSLQRIHAIEADGRVIQDVEVFR